MNNDFRWLQDLKAGDQVIYRVSSWSGTRERVATVDRVTETFVIVNGAKYRKADASVVGQKYTRGSLAPATPEALARIAEVKERDDMERRLRDGLKRVTYQEGSYPGLSLDQMRRIVAILEEQPPE